LKIDMKTAWKISILLNLGMFGVLLFLLRDRGGMEFSSIPVVASIAHPATAGIMAPVIAASSSMVAAPFRWSQLDSKDYHVYVKNLREIGCPEPTVRAIVTADVDSVFRIYARQLEQQLSDLENASWPKQLGASSSEATLKDELDKVPDQEAEKIADLLGLKPVLAPVLATAPSFPQKSLADVPSAMPLVLQNIDPVALNLNDEQMQVITSLRQDFTNQVGEKSLDSNDPTYLARWHQAQAYEDSMLQGLLGNQVYTKFQMLQMTAQNQAADNQGSAAQ
jgi:hypothetical protein